MAVNIALTELDVREKLIGEVAGANDTRVVDRGL